MNLSPEDTKTLLLKAVQSQPQLIEEARQLNWWMAHQWGVPVLIGVSAPTAERWIRHKKIFVVVTNQKTAFTPVSKTL